MFSFLANHLRSLATSLDGREFEDTSWHRVDVKATNRYIGQTERYIVALEAIVPNDQVEALRKKHGRFDTKRLIEAGAWKDK